MVVVGYDNREFTWIVRPNITTVTMPVYEMGRIAAEILLRQITDGTRENDEVKVKGDRNSSRSFFFLPATSRVDSIRHWSRRLKWLILLTMSYLVK